LQLQSPSCELQLQSPSVAVAVANALAVAIIEEEGNLLLTLIYPLVENRPFVAGGKGLLSRAAIRDKQGAIKGRPFVAGRLRPAT
jgi:hypothetical protein